MQKKPFKIPSERLKILRAELAALKPKPKSEYAAREMLVEAEAEIRAALALGYDLNDIAEMVSKHGAKIKPSTLSTYLRELYKKPRGKKATKPKTKADPADATSAATSNSETTPKSQPTEFGSTHAETKSAIEQEEAVFEQLLEQRKSKPGS